MHNSSSEKKKSILHCAEVSLGVTLHYTACLMFNYEQKIIKEIFNERRNFILCQTVVARDYVSKI